MIVKVFMPFVLILPGIAENGEATKEIHFPSDQYPPVGMTFIPFNEGPALKIMEMGLLPDGASSSKTFIRTQTFQVANKERLASLKKDKWSMPDKSEILKG